MKVLIKKLLSTSKHIHSNVLICIQKICDLYTYPHNNYGKDRIDGQIVKRCRKQDNMSTYRKTQVASNQIKMKYINV